MTGRPWIDGPYRFEPHKLYGTNPFDGADGPWPFGYISTRFPQPIFQLRPIIRWDDNKLRSVAVLLSEAPNLYEALAKAEAYIAHIERNLAGHEDNEILTTIRTALSRARGGQALELSEPS